MSHAAATPSPSQSADLVPAGSRRNRLSALEALERGFALFRSSFGREAWRYYVGTAPLVVCLIPMWVLNGQIRISNGALFIEAVLLATCYFFRVWMCGSYMRNVRHRAFSTPISKSSGVTARLAAAGRLLAWKIVFSVGALTTLPSLAGPSWFYSACQFASLEAQEDAAERHSLVGCLALASQWFGGSAALLLSLFALWTAVWLNGLILALIFPQLLHSIFGVNTLLSTRMGIFALIQSSAFWLSLFAGTWVALDPVVKCTFIVVHQHLRSRREGYDLRGLLASLPRENQKKAQIIASIGSKVLTGALLVLAIILGCFSLSTNALAAQLPSRSTTETRDNSVREVRVEKLRAAIDQESERAIYRWHDAEHPSQPTWFDKLLDKIGHIIERAWNRFWELLRKLWPSGLNLSPGNGKAGWQLKDLRVWLTLLAVLTFAIAAVFFWLRRRRPAATQLSMSMALTPLPDLSDAAAARERSEDEWFSIASRLQAEGQLQLALRAAYFGLLAGLEQRQWLTIRRDRTNREYLNEFTRRWRRRPQASVDARVEVPEKLRGSLRQFDRVWYGSHKVTPETVMTYCNNQREFLSHV